MYNFVLIESYFCIRVASKHTVSLKLSHIFQVAFFAMHLRDVLPFRASLMY